MPAYKNPVYSKAREYINSSMSEPLPPSQVIDQGKELVSALEGEIAHNRLYTWNIFEKLNELEAQGLDTGDKYLHLISTFIGSVRKTNHHFRNRDKVREIQGIDPSIQFQVLNMTSASPENGHADLTNAYIRSSQKLGIYYSQLFKVTMDLTDNQWNLIESLFPIRINESAGHPSEPPRAVLNGIFWKLRTGASWLDLPPGYPSHQTCYRYFSKWVKGGALNRALQLLMTDLKSDGLDLNEALRSSDIELIPYQSRLLIRFAPHLVDTWQGSTALLLLQVGFKEMKNKGSLPSRSAQVFTSTMDAIKTFTEEAK